MRRFIIRMRLMRARALLTEGNATVASVALQAGFQSLSQFHDHFRRAYGTTPQALREGRRAGGATPSPPRRSAPRSSPSSCRSPGLSRADPVEPRRQRRRRSTHVRVAGRRLAGEGRDDRLAHPLREAGVARPRRLPEQHQHAADPGRPDHGQRARLAGPQPPGRGDPPDPRLQDLASRPARPATARRAARGRSGSRTGPDAPARSPHGRPSPGAGPRPGRDGARPAPWRPRSPPSPARPPPPAAPACRRTGGRARAAAPPPPPRPPASWRPPPPRPRSAAGRPQGCAHAGRSGRGSSGGIMTPRPTRPGSTGSADLLPAIITDTSQKLPRDIALPHGARP